MTALATTLSHSLSLDAGKLIPELWGAESARLSKETTSAAESDHPDEPAGHEAEEMEEEMRDEKKNGRKPNGRMSKPKNDISDLLPVSWKLLSEKKRLHILNCVKICVKENCDLLTQLYTVSHLGLKQHDGD